MEKRKAIDKIAEKMNLTPNVVNISTFSQQQRISVNQS